MTQPAPSLHIRQLCAADLDQLFDHRSRPAGERWLEQQAHDEVYIAVAELDGIPVARIGIDFMQLASQGMVYLWSAHVEPAFQSRGIGTAVLLHLETVTQAHGFNTIRLDVNKPNLRARRLYERLGYAVNGEAIGRWSYRDGDQVIEVVDDNWTMRKSLAT